jgi:hypothetical protein
MRSKDIKHASNATFAGVTALTIVMCFSFAQPSLAAKKSTKTASNSYSIREKCIMQAQAAYPDNGMGTASVMTQRTDVYRNCATKNGIRP